MNIYNEEGEGVDVMSPYFLFFFRSHIATKRFPNSGRFEHHLLSFPLQFSVEKTKSLHALTIFLNNLPWHLHVFCFILLSMIK